MLAQLSHWVLIAILSQAPAEPAWLKVIPADVDVAVHTRGLEATRDDLVAMLKAMNPDWGNMAEGGLAGPLGDIRQRHGEQAVKSPWVGVMRQGGPGEEGLPVAILIVSDNYKRTLNELVGGHDPELKHQDDGYDAFDGPEGHGTWYAVKTSGVVAFGPSKHLIASIAKPGGKTLDSVLKESTARSFLSGDLGVYVNGASLTTRYADQIEQAHQQFMALMDQAAQQQGNAAMAESIKDFYGGLFDSIKNAEALTLRLDVAAKGLHLSGILNVKPDAPGAKSIPEYHPNAATKLGNFPAGAMAYVYMDLEAKTLQSLQNVGLRMISQGKPSPELEKAMAAFHSLGRIESLGSSNFGNGMRSLNATTVSDPGKYIAAQSAMLQAMKGGEGKPGVYKDVKIEPDVQSHQGLKFTRIVATLDLDKLAHLAGNNPAQAEAMKSMFGGDTITYWFGTDGKRLLTVLAPTWDEVKAQIDGYLKGELGVGASPSFQAVRAELPEKASVLVLLNTQNLLEMIAAQLAKTLKNPDLKVPDDLPKDAAFVGAAVTPQPPLSYEFHLVVPSSVGTVIDKGLIPMFRGLRPQGANQ